MDIKEKVMSALSGLHPEFVRLEDDDGLTGFVVSSRFEGKTALDRQAEIEDALDKAATPLTADERRRVLAIAGLTPTEYSATGSRIRIHRIKEMSGGAFEILLHGGPPDADYLRHVLEASGMSASGPTEVGGGLMSFRVKGTKAQPLTKAHIGRLLRRDQYVEVMPSA